MSCCRASAGSNSGPNSSSNSGTDSSSNSGSDSGTDSSPNSGSDSGTNSSSDSGTNSSSNCCSRNCPYPTMIENEMLFLGLLLDGPKHGYEIKRKIAQELLPLVGLKIKSVYYPLQRLEQGELIARDTGREGKFPEKFIYRITAKGKRRFDELITKSFSAIERPYFNLDLSLYFLQHIDHAIARRKLKTRLAFLSRIQRNINAYLAKKPAAKSGYLPIILEHDLDLVKAEINSVRRLIGAFA